MGRETFDDLLERNRELEIRLEEAEETLRALRNGEVDAVVAAGPGGDRVYTLRGADEAYRVIVQEMAEGALTLAPDGLILFSNERFASIVGIPLENVIGSQIQNFVAPEDAHVLSALLTGGNPRKAEVRLKAGDAEVPAYLSVKTVSLDEVECLCVVVTDLTGQKQNEEIVASEKLARSILDQAAGAILVVDPRGTIIRASRAAELLAGAAVLLRRFNGVFALRASSDSKAFGYEDILSMVRRDGSIAGLEATARTGDGRDVDLLVDAALLTGADAEFLGSIIILNDVSALKQAERALIESERRYRSLFENSIDGVFLTLTDGRIVAANPAACALLGMTEEEICRFGREGVTDAADPRLRAAIDERRRTGRAQSEVTFIRRDGSKFLAEASSVEVDRDGRAFVIVRDITKRRKAESDLRESEGKYRALFESMQEGFALAEVVCDDAGKPVDWRYLDVNPAFEVMFGHKREELIGRTLQEVFPGASGDYWVAGFGAVALTGKPAHLERYGDVTGRRYEAIVYSPRRGQFAAIFTDVTERRRAEERLRQTQKLESIGLLAGGIAHDFNNLLTGIMGNASLLQEDVAPNLAEPVRNILKGSERAAHLTRQLLAYSGKGHFFIQDLNLTNSLREMVDLMRLSIPKSVELRLDTREGLPLIEMDPSQLHQTVMNLIINAGEAIGEGNRGTISVATGLRDLNRPFVDSAGQEAAAGRYVYIEVNDDGQGMDEETKSKVFDPFFTTKFTGRGLGLAAVAGIVRSQKGAITVESEPGRGTTFRVLFPAVRAGRDRVEAPSTRPLRGTILVIDDDESVRQFVAATLRRQDYGVLEACDGIEALQICDEQGAAVDAVILDIVMPVMGAAGCLPELKRRRPDLKVLLTSGYSETEARRLCASYEGADFIQKPYTAQQLAGAVEVLLRRRTNIAS